jgi:prolyl 4-hydroxylase
MRRAPVIAPSPYKLIRTPSALIKALLNLTKTTPFYPRGGDPEWDFEYGAIVKDGIYNLKGDLQVNVCSIPYELLIQGLDTLTPLVEEWAMCKIIPTAAYGIREYTRGCQLAIHRDEVDTHILSAITHVEDTSSEPWPLDFVDHAGVHHEILMRTGDTLLYESICPHGRVKPFNGSYFRNCYFHWAPVNWDPSVMRGVKAKFSSLGQAIEDMKLR